MAPSLLLSFIKLLVSFSLTVLLSKILQIRARASTRHLPPGPPRLPLIGNLHQLSIDAWKPFTEWKEIYGPIVYLKLATQNVIVLNTLEVAADLLDDRAAFYSDRPNWIVACQMLTEGLFMPFVRYGETWRRMRRAAHQGLNKTAVEKYKPIQTKEAMLLLRDLYRDAKDWEIHVRRAGGSTVLGVTYDIPTIKSINHFELSTVYDFTIHLVNTAYVDSFLVEFFPWLQHLPASLMAWKRQALAWSRESISIFHAMFQTVKKDQMNGLARHSLTGIIVEQQDKFGLNDTEIAWMVAAIAAASETMSGVVAWFFLAMVMYPDVQKKAQEEIDRVVGRDRLPCFEDMGHLPYIRAIVTESLRLNPIDPLGLQHRSTVDDVYKNYFIPKGTICIANVWAMNRDVDVYGPDAHIFNPERHLDAQGNMKPAIPRTKNESHSTFGFGRRICVGRYLANNSLFLNMASILWMFTIHAPIDANGDPVPLCEDTVNEGLVVRPLPYKYTFVPRCVGATEILFHALGEENGNVTHD